MDIADINVKVSVEAVLHTAINKFLQDISDDYGIQVEDISVSWARNTRGGAVIHSTDIRTHKR